MTSIFPGGTSTNRRMSRLELSDPVRMRVERRAARVMDVRAYASDRRVGRDCGNIRGMQSWVVTTDGEGTSGGRTEGGAGKKTTRPRGRGRGNGTPPGEG